MITPPIRPERPTMPPREEKPRGNNWITILLAFLMAVGGLFSLMVMPLVGYAPVIVLAVFGFVALHYCVWGWWLTGKLRDEQNDEQE